MTIPERMEPKKTIKNKDADVIGFQLFNPKGEEVEMYYNLAEKTFTMDRTKSGEVSFRATSLQ